MKQTEVGLIPDDWEVKRLGDNVDILRGGSPRPIENYLTTKADGINWIKIGDVRPNDKYIRKTEEKIIPEGKSRSREVKKGDLILSNSMSFGRPYILAIDGCIHDGWLTIQNYSESFDKEFLYYLLGSDEVFKQYVQMAAGSSVQNLNKEKVADLQLKVPPFVEQQRIAKALSDVDALISTTEKLLQKKKNIKQGTMQNLLTGKKRLPGFGDKQTDLFVPNGTHTKEVKDVSPEQ
ncbi:restriction endonuclease subunit S, partial [Treponema sp.]|uniref:restriction endonuclease subunit S n=1 Tax=Treponema sp. TaxID=166 RepID=UPI00298D70BB